MPLTPYSGTWSAAQAKHLLRRGTFGLRRADITYFSGLTMSQAVNELLAVPSSPPSPPLNDYSFGSASPDPNVPYGTTWVNSAYDSTLNYPRFQSLRAWWAGLMINENRSIVEKMTLFYHNLMPTNMGGSVNNHIYCYEYLALIRSYALGNFKDLVKDMSVDRGMLTYLDGKSNTNTSPNENYARELQELFTIGKDLTAYYTEDDVKAAAKALTGWRLNGGTANSNGAAYARYFDPTKHDTSNKVFSSFYNNTVIAGQTGASSGTTELTALMNMIFSNDEVANYFIRKLYRFFVYYKITPTIESTIIQPLATTFRTNGYNILPVLQELLTSQHFYDMGQVGCVIKSPIEYTVGFGRATEMTPPSASDYYNLYRFWRVFYDRAGDAQMYLGSPPNVAGWVAWGEGPNYHELWISADTLRNRKKFADTICGNGYNGTVKINLLDFTESLTAPGDPNLLIDELFELFHPLPGDTALKTTLKQTILLSNQIGDYYWTTAWNNYVGNKTNTTYVNTAKSRLKDLYIAILNMAEAHLA